MSDGAGKTLNEKVKETKARLYKIRSSLGWSKTRTAKEIGVSVGTYSNWEYGNRRPTNESLDLITKAFGLSGIYILSGDPVTDADYFFVKKGKLLKFQDSGQQSVYIDREGRPIKIDADNRQLFESIMDNANHFALVDLSVALRNTKYDYKQNAAVTTILQGLRVITMKYVPLDQKKEAKKQILESLKSLTDE